MTIRQAIRGVVGASLLALVCSALSACVCLMKGATWPNIELQRLLITFVPAMAFWFWYFARHWRGAGLLRQCWSRMGFISVCALGATLDGLCSPTRTSDCSVTALVTAAFSLTLPAP
jgi:hypothetical protein